MMQRIDYRSITVVARLDDTVPSAFGEWRVVSNESLPIVNPQLRESLKNDYDETLTRTYQNRISGRYVMLSIAYGRDQSHEKQIHKPEVCYPAQGFSVDSVRESTFAVAGRDIPVTTLHATKDTRNEYIAYWIVEGDSIVRGALQQNFRRALLAIRGIREDGLLFRVSEISEDQSSAIALLREFSDGLVSAIDPRAQKTIIGALTSAPAGHS
jgi:EpsI family protein